MHFERLATAAMRPNDEVASADGSQQMRQPVF